MLLLFRQQSQETSSSSTQFQLGLETTVSAEIPGTGVTVGATIPPIFTYGSENSESSSRMRSFFEEESGYSVTLHAECTKLRMVIASVN